MQFSFNFTGQVCKTLDSARVGEASGFASGLYSDWMFERIEQWRNNEPPCEGEWFLYYEDSEDMQI
jgi:hypothetical protein